VRVERGQCLIARNRQKSGPAFDAAALAQELERERPRAAAVGTDCHPRARQFRQPVGLGPIDGDEDPHRLVVERAKRHHRRRIVHLGQRHAEPALDECRVDAPVAQQREILGRAASRNELERHAVLREALAVPLAVLLVRPSARACRHDEMVGRRRLHVLEGDPERQRNQRNQGNGDNQRVARPPVAQSSRADGVSPRP
jgi:hypothetical protein